TVLAMKNSALTAPRIIALCHRAIRSSLRCQVGISRVHQRAFSGDDFGQRKVTPTVSHSSHMAVRPNDMSKSHDLKCKPSREKASAKIALPEVSKAAKISVQ